MSLDYLLPKFAKGETENNVIFLRNCLVGSLIALVIGAVIDNSFAAALGKGNSNRGWAILFFLTQLTVNIMLLFALCKYSRSFLYWIQITTSGLLFTVLLFLVQHTLAATALSATKFV